MSAISILDIEQRMDLLTEVSKLEDFFINHPIYTVSSHFNLFYKTLNDLLEEKFTSFPASGTSRNINEFLYERGISKSISFISEETYYEKENPEYYIYLLNLYANYLLWLKSIGDYQEFNTNFMDYELYEINDDNIESIMNRISLILESQNYQNIINDEINEHGFHSVYTVKRDVDVDSVLNIVDKPIALDLLSFLDFRFEYDLKHKEEIIRRLYIDLEKNSELLFLDKNQKLYKDTKFLLNIPRHHKDHLSEEERLEIANQAFYHYIHLNRDALINSFQEKLSILKSKQ